eukprot:12977768-Alexandrium_andersonii.AAC.1
MAGGSGVCCGAALVAPSSSAGSAPRSSPWGRTSSSSPTPCATHVACGTATLAGPSGRVASVLTACGRALLQPP